jgi:RNA polymerase subunit RPABC4/transcription elongation factor Spt4
MSAIDDVVVVQPGIVTCSRCGNVVSSSYKYCPMCGAIPLVPRFEPTPVSVCPGCGILNPSGSNFCARCGSSMRVPVNPTPMPQRQSRRGIVVVAVLLVVAVLILSMMMVNILNMTGSNTTMGSGESNFVWHYGGDTFRLKVDIPTDLYLEYERDSIRRYALNINDAVELSKRYVTTDETIVTNISSMLYNRSMALGLDDEAKINFVLSFVQSIPYIEDEASVSLDEYWRFPVETLYDNQGDCEDKSFLFASLMESMGFDAVILIFDSHAAVGVECSGVYGSYYSYEGNKYYYCETTAEGWAIGDIPDQYGAADIAQVS